MLAGSRVATHSGVNTLSVRPATGGAAFSRYFQAISMRWYFVATKFDVAYWHFSDMPARPRDVCFGGKSDAAHKPQPKIQ